MRKYAAIALCTSAILAGCNTSNVSQEPKKEKGSRSSYTKRGLYKNKVKFLIPDHTRIYKHKYSYYRLKRFFK